MTLPVALMMPLVTVSSRPKGLPTARTHSPTFTLSESPRGKRREISKEGRDLDQDKVCFGIPSDDFSLVLLPFRQFHFDLVGVLDDMIVGDDIPIFIDDKSRAQALLFEVPVRNVTKKPFEKITERGSPPSDRKNVGRDGRERERWWWC